MPFSLRLIHAEIASLSSSPYISIVRTGNLIDGIDNVIEMISINNTSGAEIAIWIERLGIYIMYLIQ